LPVFNKVKEDTKNYCPRLSVYILAFNEEEKIGETLESVNWADEIVVVDSFSTDRTVEIAEEYGANVVQEKFQGFGKLRVAGIRHTTNPWIFTIDSDERCTPDAKEEILKIINDDHSADAYLVPRRNYFMGKLIRFGGWYPNYRQPQLFRRGKMTFPEEDLVHEGYILDGRLAKMRNPINQIPFRNLSEVLRKMDRYSELGARKLKQKGKSSNIGKACIRALWTFVRIYLLRLGFLDGWAGFVIAFGNLEGAFYKYAKLSEVNRIEELESKESQAV
jgi:glycosyltransferase involved in cell wall biosynthesis